MPQLGLQQNLRWSVQWPLRVPLSGTQIIPIGLASVLICRTKILFFLCITRQGGQYPPGVDPPSMVLPLVYDLQTNITQLAEKRDQNHSPSSAAVNLHLKRFGDYHANAHNDQNSLFPAIRDLLASLVLPNEPPQLMAPMAAAQVTTDVCSIYFAIHNLNRQLQDILSILLTLVLFRWLARLQCNHRWPRCITRHCLQMQWVKDHNIPFMYSSPSKGLL